MSSNDIRRYYTENFTNLYKKKTWINFDRTFDYDNPKFWNSGFIYLSNNHETKKNYPTLDFR